MRQQYPAVPIHGIPLFQILMHGMTTASSECDHPRPSPRGKRGERI